MLFSDKISKKKIDFILIWGGISLNGLGHIFWIFLKFYGKFMVNK
jgi:hypothetical protein